VERHVLYHGVDGDKMQSLLENKKLIPSKQGELYFARFEFRNTFVHGVDEGRGGALTFKLSVEIPSGVKLERPSTSGVPDTLVVKTTEPVKFEVLEMYFRPSRSVQQREAGDPAEMRKFVGENDIRQALKTLDLRPKGGGGSSGGPIKPSGGGSSGGPITPTAKIGPHMRVAGRFALHAGVGLLINWVIDKFFGGMLVKQQEEGARRRMSALQPRIAEDFRRNKRKALELVDEGSRAYATMRYSVRVTHMHMGHGAGWASAAPDLDYEEMEITEQPVATPEGTWKEDGKERRNFVAPGAMSETTFYKVSVEVTFSREEITRYRILSAAILFAQKRYDAAPADHMDASDATRWASAKEALKDDLRKAKQQLQEALDD
jgi:hypothetical protein